jgi:hypothetical protein
LPAGLDFLQEQHDVEISCGRYYPAFGTDLLPGMYSDILGGISIFFPTYLMVFTGKSLSRMNLQYEGALEHLRTQAPVEAGQYLITR